MPPKDTDGMTDSEDPDQTFSSLICFCTVCSGLSVRKLTISQNFRFVVGMATYIPDNKSGTFLMS